MIFQQIFKTNNLTKYIYLRPIYYDDTILRKYRNIRRKMNVFKSIILLLLKLLINNFQLILCDDATNSTNYTILVANPGEYPYVVSLEYEMGDINAANRFHFCAGAIISEWYAVTVTECGSKYPEKYKENVYVVAGISRLSDMNAVVRKMDYFKAHPWYAEKPKEHNIAVVKVTEKLTWNELIRPIPFSEPPDRLFKMCVVTSWSFTNDSGKYTDDLKSVAATETKDTPCVAYGKFYPDNMLCVTEGIPDDLCDSGAGAPFVCDGHLYGLSRHPQVCGTQPHIFMSVFYYYEWLDLSLILINGDAKSTWNFNYFNTIILVSLLLFFN